MGYLNNSGLTRFWNAIKSKFIRTINGIGPDSNGNVSVDTCEFINGTQTAATGSFTGVSRDSSLYDGKHIIYRLPYAGSGNATLNLTLADGTTTGAKNVWRAPGTRLTTHYAAGNFLGMTYFQSDDSWHCDVDVDTDSYAYGVRLCYTIYKVKTVLYRYQIVLTRDEDTLLPVNTVDNNTGTTKQLTTVEFDPFGEIYWYWTTTTISAGSYAAGTNLLSQYWLVDLRYSFNTGTTLTAYKDVYLVCEPRPNGKAVLAPNPISQSLPSSEDGYVYIRLGKAYDTYRITLDLHKPRYYYANGEIREWTNSPTDAKLAEYNTDEDVFQIRHAKAEKPSYNSEVVRKITGGTLAWNQLVNGYTWTHTEKGLTFTNNSNESITVTGTITEAFSYNALSLTSTNIKFVRDGRKYLIIPSKPIPFSIRVMGYNSIISANGIGGIFTRTDGGTWQNGVGITAYVGDTLDIQNFSISVFDLTQMFGSTIADRIYALEQATAGAGVAWFRRYFNRDYYEYAQTLANTYFDQYETTGFNLLDIDSLYNQNAWTLNGSKLTNKITDTRTNAQINIQALDIDDNFITNLASINVTSTGRYNLVFVYNNSSIYRIRIKHNGSSSDIYICYIYRSSLVLNNSYCLSFTVESNNPTTVGGLIIGDICINLSDASRNGQYEPYRRSRITFFDNPVLLRGIPYLDENDNLRFNGDTLEAPGKITRRYQRIKLDGTNVTVQSMAQSSSNSVWYAIFDIHSFGYGSGINSQGAMRMMNDKGYREYPGVAVGNYYVTNAGKYIVVCFFDQTLTTPSAVNTYLQSNPIDIVYELATPTEEEFTPIDGPLVSDPLGLEVIAKSDWDDTPILAQMDILYANEVRANVEMITTNKVIASQNSAKDLSKCITVKPGKLLANGTDLNTVKTFGEYYLRVPGTLNTYTNAAFIGNSKLLVIDMQGSDYDDPMYSGGVMQIQIGEIYDSTTGVRTNKAYSRIYYSGTTWSSWKPIQGGSGLFYGTTATAAATATKDVVCPEFTAVDLVPGTTISVKFDNTNSAAVGSLALNVNGTGAHNVKYVYNGSYSNIPGANYIKAGQLYLFTYDGTYWVVQMMYNTNSVPGLYYYTKKTYTVLNPYMLCLTKDSEYVLPVNTQNTTATTKTMTTEVFDPFGEIYYYAGSSAVSAGGYPNGSLYNSFTYSSVLDIRYSFNTGTTLTARKDVYLVCQPQFSSGKPTGKVTLYTPYVTQTIPVTDQSNPVMGLIYIKIGNAYDIYRIQLDPQKPIYYYDGANIVPWHGFETLQSTDITIANGDKLVVTDASDNDKVARTSVAFDGSTTSQVLSKKGTWVSLPSTPTAAGVTDVPQPDAAIGDAGTSAKYARADHVHPTSVHGIPSGGTTGQFLVKNSNTNYDVSWVTVPNANGVSF